ncbi:MAG: glycoside hydrolase family 32 protein, partial [Chthoniobacterales bacterium]
RRRQRALGDGGTGKATRKLIHPMNPTLTLLSALLLMPLAALHAADKPAQSSRPNIVLADFEQGYGNWTVEGEAFNHPTTTISGGAMGFVGKGLADSWDPQPAWMLTAVMTSPKFTIERRFIHFLIGGARGSLELFIAGKKEFHLEAVGEERTLKPWALDVSPFLGREAQLVIRDATRKAYIAVDEIVAGDSVPKGTRVVVHKSQCVVLDKQMDLQGMRYLIVPISYTAPRVPYSFEVDGQKKFDMPMPLAIDVPVDFWGSYPLDEAWNGKSLRLTSTQPVVPREHREDFLRQITLSDQPRDQKGIYTEPGRPQLLYTIKRGWSNDPNGVFFYEGLWYIFYQYSPLGIGCGVDWGHATSPDLFHWTEQPPAIRRGLSAFRPGLYFRPFSGGGLVDYNNDSGLKQGVHPPILLFHSQNNRSATALAYSVDGGKTFRQYEKNPLFLTRDPSGHDPKVVWYPKKKKWVMVICDMLNGNRSYDFYESKNLLDWKYLSTAPGSWSECPDFFPMTLDGDQSRIYWVLHSFGHGYQIGDFNGREFIPEPKVISTFRGEFGAGQTFDNAPDGRRIMMGCLSGGLGYHWDFYKNDPDLQVAGGMNLPLEVTLRTSPTGKRLYLNPVKEIETLVSQRHDFKNVSLKDLSAKLSGIKPELFDIEFEWDAALQGDFQLKVWDREIFTISAKGSTYEVHGRNMSVDQAKLKVTPVNGTIKVRLICDRSICSYFINDGYEAGNRYLAGFRPECKQALSLQGDGGTLFKTFQVRALQPTWKTTQKQTTN